jgi:hypothetical protein
MLMPLTLAWQPMPIAARLPAHAVQTTARIGTPTGYAPIILLATRLLCMPPERRSREVVRACKSYLGRANHEGREPARFDLQMAFVPFFVSNRPYPFCFRCDILDMMRDRCRGDDSFQSSHLLVSQPSILSLERTGATRFNFLGRNDDLRSKALHRLNRNSKHENFFSLAFDRRVSDRIADSEKE